MSDFIGRYLNKVDKKGRVSVPAVWRPKLIGKDFSGIIAQLDLNDPLLEENEYESTVIFGGAILSFDNEGRVVLSEALRSEIKLMSEALFVGMGRRFRIWNPEIFNDYLDRAKLHMDKRRKIKS